MQFLSTAVIFVLFAIFLLFPFLLPPTIRWRSERTISRERMPVCFPASCVVMKSKNESSTNLRLTFSNVCHGNFWEQELFLYFLEFCFHSPPLSSIGVHEKRSRDRMPWIRQNTSLPVALSGRANTDLSRGQLFQTNMCCVWPALDKTRRGPRNLVKGQM